MVVMDLIFCYLLSDTHSMCILFFGSMAISLVQQILHRALHKKSDQISISPNIQTMLNRLDVPGRASRQGDRGCCAPCGCCGGFLAELTRYH